MSTLEFVLLLTPGLPGLLAVTWPLRRLRRALPRLAALAPLPALALALTPGAEGTALVLPAVFTGVHLALDAVGRAFLLLTAALWTAAAWYAERYHAQDARREAFFGFFLLTMAGNLGLVVAADILAFYLCFATMTFAAYGLVVHTRTGEALRAGRVYIVMAIIGEMGLLSGLFILGVASGGVPLFGLELEATWLLLGGGTEAVGGGMGGVAVLLLVLGFGVKAGLTPLHLWLPLAHPVAPTAASALLSGVMIKAGVLGWLRYLPTESAYPLLGTALMVIGVGAAFYGVVAGLAQGDAKTVLAYSSISQMGYVALGVGAILLDPGVAVLALAGVVFYVLHHGMAKGALFLSVGVAERLGTSQPKWSFLFIAALPALALAGAPFTGGARAKAVVKAVIEELGGTWYAVLDPLLLLAAAGTTLLMARFLVLLERRMGGHTDEGGALGLAVPWLAVSAVGLAASLWLPLAYVPPEALVLPPLRVGLAEAAGPVLLAGALAWLVWSAPERLGALTRFRVPAGDLVVLFEWAWSRTRRLPQEAFLSFGEDMVEKVRNVQRESHEYAAWLAERDLYLMRGPLLGALLLAFTLLVGALLL